MNSTATLNRREIARLQQQRAHLEQEADAAGESTVAELLRDRFAFMAWTLRLLVQSDTATPFDHTPQPINESSP